MASDPTTWTELKTSIANWLNRTDLSTTEIPEAIALAERRFNRTIFSPERVITADLTIDAASESLPADLWGIKALYLNTDPKTVLEQMTLADLRNTYSANTTGKPQNYAIAGETIFFGPAPDASYTGKLTYIQTIPALGASQATNWLLTDHPDVYVEGALAELCALLRDGEGASLFESKCVQTIEEINETHVRRVQGGAPIRIRPPIVV
jgi:hypothetical protein